MTKYGSGKRLPCKRTYTPEVALPKLGRQDGAAGGLSFLKSTIWEGTLVEELLFARVDFPRDGPAFSRPCRRVPGKLTSKRVALERTANRLGCL